MINLIINNLYFAYPDRILLNNINLDLKSDGITCITGCNGSGKSTLLQLMHGIIKPNRGYVQWEGEIQHPKIAMVFQKPLMLRRSVLANIQFALNIQKNHADPFEYLKLLNLEHLADQSARSLSGGEQQKLEIARALALQPDIILLDEPTAHLDTAATMKIEQLLIDLSAQGKKIFCASHDMSQVQRIATDILHLQDAQLYRS